jgi:hypothetical protein
VTHIPLEGSILFTAVLQVISLGSFAYYGLKHIKNIEDKSKKDK